MAYFQFDALRKIAKYVIENDFRGAEKEDLQMATGLPFRAPQTHTAWRNYSRILKIALLVREANGRAEPTPVALALARPGEVTCDEYLHFLACAFTEPSPALQSWRPDAPFRYPLLFALKYLLVKTRMGVDPPSATLAEIVGAYGSSGFVGDEREDEFAGVALAAAAHPGFVAGRDIRQERESLRPLVVGLSLWLGIFGGSWATTHWLSARVQSSIETAGAPRHRRGGRRRGAVHPRRHVVTGVGVPQDDVAARVGASGVVVRVEGMMGALLRFRASPFWRLSIFPPSRDVAQLGSAPEWGSGGRRFESGRPD